MFFRKLSIFVRFLVPSRQLGLLTSSQFVAVYIMGNHGNAIPLLSLGERLARLNMAQFSPYHLKQKSEQNIKCYVSCLFRFVVPG